MIITLMDSVTKPINPDEVVESTWDDIAEHLMSFNSSKTKEDTPMFNLWQFKTIDQGAELGRKYKYVDGKKTTEFSYIPNTIRRCGDNALGLWGLVLDYDGAKTLEEAVKDMEGFECVFYTTFNHTTEKHKFRVVIPFSQMLSKEDFNLKLDDIKNLFPYVDNASFSLSQAIYLHSGDDSISMSFRLNGLMVDPSGFVSIPKSVYQLMNRPDVETDTGTSPYYKARVIASLKSCKGVRRPGMKGNGGVLTLAHICKSIGCSLSEFQDICRTAVAADSSVRGAEEQAVIWNEVDRTKIRKETRDKFISTYGGKPIADQKMTLEDMIKCKIQKLKEKEAA